MEEGTRAYLLAPIVRDRKGEYRKELPGIAQAGVSAVKVDGAFYELMTRQRWIRNFAMISTLW
jgi:excinuclease ABC subunit A